jgi:hypothetical protein
MPTSRPAENGRCRQASFIDRQMQNSGLIFIGPLFSKPHMQL